MKRIFAMMLSLLWACQAPSPAPQLGARRAAIYYGQRTPSALELSPAQRLAIGWLYLTAEGPQAAFCTGTLIAPKLVVTARHCTEGWSAYHISFGVGQMPNEPRATLRLDAIFEHPEVDVALLQLRKKATVRVPELAPIPPNRVPLQYSLVGREVQAAGYGQTHDDSEGRYFATVELIRVLGASIFVDGRGEQGLCFGDSGGPVMTHYAGAPVVLAVEHGGEESCVGVDELTRLDPLIPWMNEVTGDLLGACGRFSDADACEGPLRVTCEDASLRVEDCGETETTCQFRGEAAGCFVDPCPTLPVRGLCEADHALYCEDGRYYDEPCAAGCHYLDGRARCLGGVDAAIGEARADEGLAAPRQALDRAEANMLGRGGCGVMTPAAQAPGAWILLWMGLLTLAWPRREA
ncbi:trypsin-like serine protease [Myxococcota bacterium]|nr:trypsin-like serine protease [Myxococcota bacterium]